MKKNVFSASKKHNLEPKSKNELAFFLPGDFGFTILTQRLKREWQFMLIILPFFGGESAKINFVKYFENPVLL